MISQDLANYRKAIASHNWLEAGDILPILLGKLDSNSMIKLAVEQTTVFLPTFEEYYPDVSWPRIALTIMAQGKQVDPDVPFGKIEDRYFAPGCESFLEAICFLDNAYECKDDRERCIIKTDIAISHALAAKVFDYGFRNVPTAWVTPEINEEDTDSFPIIWLGASGIQQYKETLQSKLADEIERILSQL
jgi:hypothetical protein